MWRAKRINGPATIFLMSNQGTNANDRVINMLGKLVAHRGADFVIALAVVPVGSGEAVEMRNGFDIPNDHVAHVAHSTEKSETFLQFSIQAVLNFRNERRGSGRCVH